MKRLNTLLSVFAIAISVFSISYSTNQPPKLAYVESNRLLSGYAGMQIEGAKYQEKLSVWNANIDTLRSELQKEIDEYESKKKSMTTKEKELSEKLIGTKQKQFLDYRKSIEEKAANEDRIGTQKVLDEVNQFVQKYGDDNGYDMIIGANESGNLIYSNDMLNLTDEILELLNEQYENP